MKDVSAAAAAKFPLACDKSCSAYGLGYCEQAFGRILELERKRSERSKNRFLLVLLSLDGGQNQPCSNIGEKLFSCLSAVKRDIDVLGWYAQNEVAGIIFTEISGGNDYALCEAIGGRIRKKLSWKLDSEEIERVHISFCFFPEKPGRIVSARDLRVYPDIRGRQKSFMNRMLVKRAIDICGSLAALVLFLPLFVLIAAAIKLSSRGPVIFRQRRVGQYGEIFTFLKFRSMYVDSDPSPHVEYTRNLIRAGSRGSGGQSRERGVFKLRGDLRVTPLGRFLRRSSLDEIPQFLNVLAGNMSLVGPRPPIPYEVENYDLWHWRRVLEMKPGITGIWQVRGRSRNTFDDMVRLDIDYITNWSLRLDLKLICMTPLAVLSARGAY